MCPSQGGRIFGVAAGSDMSVLVKVYRVGSPSIDGRQIFVCEVHVLVRKLCPMWGLQPCILNHVFCLFE